MSDRSTTEAASLTPGPPTLPHWEVLPDDIAAATRQFKAAVRARFAWFGRSVDDVAAELESALRAEVEEIKAIVASGRTAFPVLQFADIAAGRVTDDDVALLKRRGCVVIRGTFDRAQAEAWDASMLGYVESNGFFDAYSGPADDFFGTLEQSRPEIFPIYWSRGQMEARQHPNMHAVQSFLNSLWTYESHERRWFEPGHNLAYPDRVRRRPPGTSSKGLGDHLDPGTLDLWFTEGYQRHFRHIWDGRATLHDPWDAAHRADAAHYPGSTMCSAFRTFQGWTALSEMRHDQGVLHTIPIARAIAWLMLRPLLDDVPDDDLCGVQLNRAFPAPAQWHDWLLEGRAGIPDVQPGDSVWWHCDMIHSVAPVDDQQGWGNVMYIPAAPWCPLNASYAEAVRAALEVGDSPPDFPEEHYERTWHDRFAIDELNDIGRAGVGLA